MVEIDACHNGTAKMNQTCTFECDLGYRLTGEREITCGAGGNWSATEPTCDGELSVLVASLCICWNTLFCCVPKLFFNCFIIYIDEDQFGIVQNLTSHGRTICLAIDDNNQIVKRDTTDTVCESEKGLWAIFNVTGLQNVYSRECITVGSSSTTFEVKELRTFCIAC